LLELFYSETEKPKLKFLKQSSIKQALMAPTPGTYHIVCHVGKVGASYVGANMRYLGANDDDAEDMIYFLK
jgi:hypothetical protein